MKLMKILLCVLMLGTLLLPMTVSADTTLDDNFVDEIGQIDCPYGTPTIDGVIDAAEGWSAAQFIDKTNTDGCWGGEDVVITGNIYRAWDNDNLYIAADISVPEYTICTGIDDIDVGGEVGNRPGWNGDVFVYSVDPLQALLNAGFNNDAAPWYCFGLFEGGTVKTFRTHLNDADITDTVSGKGAQTATGWRFEVALPWTLLCEDTEEYSFGEAPLTPEITAKAGNKISGSMIYYDRVFDDEQGSMITGSRYVTIAKTLPDGTPGVMCSGWILQAHGMHFMLSGSAPDDGGAGGSGGTNGEATTAPTSDPSVTDVPKDTVVVTDDSGNKVTDVSGKDVTAVVTKKPAGSTAAQATGSATGQGSSQTIDIAIAVAVGTLVVSGIGLVATRKRR
ncbi:MAG: hypothetical protein E7652_04975 [Ruminococcaceae bacterium]|nr:hypothetical protein [Oscillospiraceae bacterium]